MDFTELFTKLDSTTKTLEKVRSIAQFFNDASEFEKLWGLYILLGKKPKKIINSTQIKELAQNAAGIPEWLFEESYTTVGDLGETISLLLAQNSRKSIKVNELSKSSSNLENWIVSINKLNPKDFVSVSEFILNSWKHLTKDEIFVFNKILMGSLRVGVSKQLVIKGLSKSTGIDEQTLQHKLAGEFDPNEVSFEHLINSEGTENKKTYPFFLASQIESPVEELGNPDEWFAEWKWDGIRAQIMKRNGEIIIWSRGEELITHSFPDLVEAVQKLPDNTVLDGELLILTQLKDVQNSSVIRSFNDLQQRLNRKKITENLMEEFPAAFYCYDILELEGKDLRNTGLVERRKILENLLDAYQKFSSGIQNRITLSKLIDFQTWEELKQIRELSRKNSAEGIMLKRKNSVYQNGRKRGDWWKWKVEPFSIDAVMIYAMRGHGRRANLYTDYTFAVWDNGKLVPFAKAYSGLTDEEINKVNSFVLKNTIDKFGPVRSVKPELVFELGFEGIQKSTRHKSGIAVRFPRILRWRTDKKPEEANSLEQLYGLLNLYNNVE